VSPNQRINDSHNTDKRLVYFLSLIERLKTEGWGERQSKWLDAVEADPTLLPHGVNAWQALE